MLRGQEADVSANLNALSNNLDVASELGVGPAQTPRDTPSTSPNAVQTSPTNLTSHASLIPNPSLPPNPSLLPALPVDNSPASLRRLAPTAPPQAFMTVPTPQYQPQPPPLAQSHSFPNGHQLPSQNHAPATPIVPSPSFAAAIGIAHAPVVSSPLATMPMSRAPSPPRAYALPEPAEILIDTRPPSRPPSRRPSEIRTDGRPVINRSRSASVNKTWSTIPNMTAATAPPSAWPSRQASPDDDDDDSEDEAPRKNKRRRSSVNRDDAPDLSFQTGVTISDDVRRQLDTIFEEFLSRVCSDCKLDHDLR